MCRNRHLPWLAAAFTLGVLPNAFAADQVETASSSGLAQRLPLGLFATH